MSRNGPSLPAQGPAMMDVAKLWAHLKAEWVTDLEIWLEPGLNTDGTPFIKMSLVSSRLGDAFGGAYIHRWAERSFNGLDYKASYNQLYDLLIVGHRAIEKEFSRLERLPAE